MPLSQRDENIPAAQKVPQRPYDVAEMRVGPGTILFHQGDEGEVAYFLEDGEVRLYHDVIDHRVELAVVRPGEMFGEMAVIDNGRRAATAIAQTACKLTQIPRRVFAKKIDAADPFVRGLLRIMMHNIRDKNAVFLRRPRSLMDHVVIMMEMCNYIDAYDKAIVKTTSSTGNHDISSRIASVIEAVQGLRHAAQNFPDLRDHAIFEVDRN